MSGKHVRNVTRRLQELAEEAGATVEIGIGGKHHYYIIRMNGQSRRKPFTKNVSNEVAQLTSIGREVRAIIQELREPSQ